MRKLRITVLDYSARSRNWQVVDFEVEQWEISELRASWCQNPRTYGYDPVQGEDAREEALGQPLVPLSLPVQHLRLLFNVVALSASPHTHPQGLHGTGLWSATPTIVHQCSTSLQQESKKWNITKSLLICFSSVTAVQLPRQPEPRSLYPSHVSLGISPSVGLRVHRGASSWKVTYNSHYSIPNCFPKSN